MEEKSSIRCQRSQVFFAVATTGRLEIERLRNPIRDFSFKTELHHLINSFRKVAAWRTELFNFSKLHNLVVGYKVQNYLASENK